MNMPGNLQWKNRDPDNRQGSRKDRGAGWYWHRGQGVHSKYTGRVDAPHKAKTTRIRDPQRRKEAQLNMPHKMDVQPRLSKKRTTSTRYKGHPVSGNPKGHY